METSDNDTKLSAYASSGRLEYSYKKTISFSLILFFFRFWDRLTPAQHYDFMTVGLIAEQPPQYVDANKFQELKQLLVYCFALTKRSLTCRDMLNYEKSTIDNMVGHTFAGKWAL